MGLVPAVNSPSILLREGLSPLLLAVFLDDAVSSEDTRAIAPEKLGFLHARGPAINASGESSQPGLGW